MVVKTRRACAQILLRLTPAERDRVRAVIPKGSLNAVTIQLLMDYVRQLEAYGFPPQPMTTPDPAQLPLEDPAA